MKVFYLKGMEFLAEGGKFRVLSDMHTRTDVSDRVKTEATRLLKAHMGHLSSREVLSTVVSNLKLTSPKPQSPPNVVQMRGPKTTN